MLAYISPYQYIIIIALCIATVNLFVNKGNWHILTILYFTLIFEIFLATYCAYMFNNNRLIYNIVCNGMVIIYFFIFKKSILDYIIASIWVIWLGINLSRIDIINEISFIPYTVGLIGVILLIIRYFSDHLFKEEFQNIWKKEETWIGLGILLFFTCSFPILINLNSLILDQSVNLAYAKLLEIGNIFLSLGYLFATLVQWKVTSHTKSSLPLS